MADELVIKKGLDIPIEGGPEGAPAPLEANGRQLRLDRIALDFSSFSAIKPRLLAKEGESVRRGQPLIQDKEHPERKFVSPATGVIKEVRRGLKRRLLHLVIALSQQEEPLRHEPLDLSSASKETLAERLLEGGLFAKIRQRPFNLLAQPNKTPRAVFVKAIESAPFTPSPDMQVEGFEESFQAGLDALGKFCSEEVHLIYRRGSRSEAFSKAKRVKLYEAEGPHPIGNHSIHIHQISPISRREEVVWTLNAHDVVCIGELLLKGTYHIERVVGIGGPGVLPEKRQFVRTREGVPIEALIAGRMPKGTMRLISGDPLMGEQVEPNDFLGFSHFAFTILPEMTDRQFLHFFRLGADKFTASRTYLSGFLERSHRLYPFTTNQHGEKRAFVISTPYDRVMPMNIPTMHLVKAVMAQDYDLAEKLGLLEVAEEDFALAAFVCPSKIEMVEIMQRGLQSYAKEVVH